MAQGQALTLFNDFMATTPGVFEGGRDRFINEAGKHSYLLRRFLRGRPTYETFSTGSKIKVSLMFDENSTAEFYKPGEPTAWSNPQVLDTAEINHRLCRFVHVSSCLSPCLCRVPVFRCTSWHTLQGFSLCHR